MGVVPDIEVEKEEKPRVQSRNGIANKIALIGAFDTTDADPQMFLSLAEAQTALGTDTSYNGCKILPIIFTTGGVLAVNITTENEGTRDKTLTTAKLTAALAKIKGEDFDMVFVADTLADEAIIILDTFLGETFKMKLPGEYVFAASRETTSAYVTTAGKVGDYCSGMVIQPGTIKGENYDLLSTAAYYAKHIADLPVRESMTNKQVPYLTSVTPEYTFETGDAGTSLVAAGVTIFKVKNRTDGRIVVVNSEQPNGYDIYINRVRNYVIKEMNLEPYLGERNRKLTLGQVEHMLDNIKYNCINTMDLLKDIQYTVEKVDTEIAEVTLNKLVFDGIITKIRVKYSIEVI